MNRGEKATMVAMMTIAAFTMAAPVGAQDLDQYDYDNLGLRGIGVELLYVDPTQNEGALGIGGRLDLGFLGPNIRLMPRLGYWKADVNTSSVLELEAQLEEVSGLEPGSINLGQIQRSAWVVGADLQYVASVAQVSPYLGVGIDVYALNDDGDAISGTFLDDAVVTAGVSGVGGLEFLLSPGWSAYGEFRATAVTDASSLGGAVGILYRFGP